MATSIGETRVRTEFNPSASGNVDQINQKSAELINMCKNLPTPERSTAGIDNRSEFWRLQSLAMMAYEEAAMWAVKAATAK